MIIFKFGGASVKEAAGVKNMVEILKKTGTKDKLIVVSAMGKTTNALELVIQNYFEFNKIDLTEVKNFHAQIAQNLFANTNHPIFATLNQYWQELTSFLEENSSQDYDFVYDQVIGFGELISTAIISAYLNSEEIKNNWIDARKLIKTDTTYRDAQVNWEITQKNINHHIKPNELFITQGFIASTTNNCTTTLGREGSDYSAAIFAYCLNAKEVSIWKDVSGVYNADPRIFKDSIQLNQINYNEAIELAFYGASVIHPKTIQPLQRKEIPLVVRSFYDLTLPGTKVSNGPKIVPQVPCFIVKDDLILLSIATKDFSFFVEQNMSEVFALFHAFQTKVDLIQNSAISFSVVIDNKFKKFDLLIENLQKRFRVSFNKGVKLYTLRHATPEAIKATEKDKVVLLKQVTRETAQLVVHENL